MREALRWRQGGGAKAGDVPRGAGFRRHGSRLADAGGGATPRTAHAAPLRRQAAVIGSMTLRTSVTRLAGKPLIRACSCTEDSSSAR